MEKYLYNLCEGCKRDIKCNQCEVFLSKEKMRILKNIIK